MSEYKLGLVEIYHPTIHGSQNPKLHTKYLYSLNIPIDSFMNDHPNGWLGNHEMHSPGWVYRYRR